MKAQGRKRPDVSTIILSIFLLQMAGVCLHPLDARAGGLCVEERTISAESYDERGPAIYGDRMAWFDSAGERPALVLYSISSGAVERIGMSASPDSEACHSPAVYKNRVAWLDGADTGNDIWVYDLTKKEKTRITAVSHQCDDPDIYEGRIVWADDRAGNFDVYMFDLGSGAERRITEDATHQRNPRIHGERIVWEDFRNGGGDIYMYDLAAGEETQITRNTAQQVQPDIYDDFIVWNSSQSGMFVKGDIFMFDLSTNSEKRLVSTGIWEVRPAIYGMKVVWQDVYEQGRKAVFMSDLSSGGSWRITEAEADANCPALWRNSVAWEDRREGNADIHVGTLCGEKESLYGCSCGAATAAGSSLGAALIAILAAVFLRRRKMALMVAAGFMALGAFSSPGFAEGKKAHVLIFDLDAKVGIDAKTAELLSGFVISKVRETGQVTVSAWKDIKTTLQAEEERQRCGSEKECRAEIGAALGCDYILIGDIGKLGETFVLNLTLVNAGRPDLSKSTTRVLKDAVEEDFLTEIPPALEDLFSWEVVSLEPAEKRKASGSVTVSGQFSHRKQLSIFLKGNGDVLYREMSGEAGAGFGIIDQMEVSASAILADRKGLKAAVTLIPVYASKAVKPLLSASGIVFWAGETVIGGGLAPGVQYEVSRNFGVILDVSFQYFPSVPSNFEAFYVIASLAVQARI